ncbi:Phage repressor [hydrothermal vent metagenome]|uniref:Phage repressor n=1 Tax=hydrothermal vent metagenome TaxID=652676 RepID=A0A3B0RGT3_9ZZZZ
MLTHKQIWRGLDNLASKTGMSISALAKTAGLDATTFNRSKRYTADQTRPRWPSTESIAKVLDAVQISFEEFALLSGSSTGRTETGRPVPLLGLAQAGSGGFFDDAGYPVGTGWDEVRFPGVTDNRCYALEISGDSMLPVFRDGDRIVVSPEESLRRGDRVVVRTLSGEVMAKELRRLTAKHIELASINPEYPGRTLERNQVEWIARIVWASQ